MTCMLMAACGLLLCQPCVRMYVRYVEECVLEGGGREGGRVYVHTYVHVWVVEGGH